MSTASADWHWWCDACDVAEARLTEAVAVSRAVAHDIDEHGGEKRAQRKQFAPEPHDSGADGG